MAQDKNQWTYISAPPISLNGVDIEASTFNMNTITAAMQISEVKRLNIKNWMPVHSNRILKSMSM